LNIYLFHEIPICILNKTDKISAEVVELAKKGDFDMACRQIFESGVRKEIVSHLVYKGFEKDTAQQVFNDGVLIFLDNIKGGKLVNSNNLSGYLYTICRNISKNEIYNDKHFTTEYKDFTANYEVEFNNPNDEAEIRNYAKKAFRAFNDMGQQCRKLMKYKYVQGFSHDEISKMMNYTGAVVARNRLHNCIETLFKKMDTMTTSFTNRDMETLIDELGKNES
jgi:RNA polymerase sigma factor (sigma-70 family)